MIFKHCFNLLLLSFFLTGCTVKPALPAKRETLQLVQLLRTLEEHTPPREAERLTADIFNHTMHLTQQFRLTSPPWFHNTLVNIGVRKKGLCYHWSDALYRYLLDRNYSHFEFHLVGANIGEYFFEHNALAVTAKGGEVKKGVIIDPWRDSGKLYFSKVIQDREYRWVHRKERECATPALQRLRLSPSHLSL